MKNGRIVFMLPINGQVKRVCGQLNIEVESKKATIQEYGDEPFIEI